MGDYMRPFRAVKELAARSNKIERRVRTSRAHLMRRQVFLAIEGPAF
jgi:hypothetical protein